LEKAMSCPTCEHPVQVPADAVVGEIVACNDCQTELEVLQVDPVELAVAPELAEDWGE
jgi:alpha-aminoadipate carrier protein LysW